MYTIAGLLVIGFVIGCLGTLIGAGGGFILVPFLLLTNKRLSPEIVTGISMAVVAANAVSGSIAYARSGRIDYKAGLLFAAFTIPGSILGVLVTAYVPKVAFRIFFGVLLVTLSVLLFLKKKQSEPKTFENNKLPKGWKHHELTDRDGEHYAYTYNQKKGILISLVIGFLSPLLGIGGGIIHVPALVQLMYFPVYIATATSHFMLAIMAAVSVAVHAVQGNYSSSNILHIIVFMSAGTIAGAQLGAYISHRLNTKIIVRALAVCLGLVGLRLLIGNLV